MTLTPEQRADALRDEAKHDVDAQLASCRAALAAVTAELKQACLCRWQSVDGDIRLQHECDAHKAVRERANAALDRERDLRVKVATLEEGKAAFFRDIYTPEREAWAAIARAAESTAAHERARAEALEAEMNRWLGEDAATVVGRQRQRIQQLEEALRFYADPFSQVDEFGDPVSVPDFYREMDFGQMARAALHPTAPGEEGGR